MWHYTAICCVALALVDARNWAKCKPTVGQIWPKVQKEITRSKYYIIRPALLNIKVINHYCGLIQNAIGRIKRTMSQLHKTVEGLRRCGNLRHSPTQCPRVRRPWCRGQCPNRLPWCRQGCPSRLPWCRQQECSRLRRSRCQGELKEVVIDLAQPCETLPYLGMNENYQLTVAKQVAVLESNSVWGIIRGLETFVQLMYMPQGQQVLHIKITHIEDYPRYKHRGLLLDTSRHYISVDNILTTLEAMAINKMNVFHWHIVDDQSFPYVSQKFPELSRKGAYNQSMVYNRRDVKKIIDFATGRGIRVVPEFDMPGHVSSWGKAFPNLYIKCDSAYFGAMNPILPDTYLVLRDLFDELRSVFPDRYFHLGGDEVDTRCWRNNKSIVKYMKSHHIGDESELLALFMNRTIPLLGRRKPIVWQEVFDAGVPLPHDTLIQVWKYNSETEMSRVIRAGYKVLFSAYWYLDDLKNNIGHLYTSDPWYMVTSAQARDIVGGEACVWTERIDDSNVISRVWPRASAVAEVLWSSLPKNSFINARDCRRIAEHTARMRMRGINARLTRGPTRFKSRTKNKFRNKLNKVSTNVGFQRQKNNHSDINNGCEERYRH